LADFYISNMDLFDVAVIGAGPAGSMAAKYAAKAGSSVVLLEEHHSIGWPVECAGLLGSKAMEESELPMGKFVIRGLKGAVISSQNARISFKAKANKAWVVDRRLFDRALALEALRAGARLRLNSHVSSIRKYGGASILAMSNGEHISADVVISAEGVKARIARQAGIGPVQKILSGAQVEVPFSMADPECVELYFGHSPGLFAWVIPTWDETARIGLCARDNGCKYLRDFLQKKFIRERRLGSPAALVVGGLPLGPPASTVADGFIAVGDAAGQVKPTSGGGIYPGLVCAKIAGGVAAAASQEGDCSSKRLGEYDKKWRAMLGRELEIGMRANRLLNKMNSSQLDEAFGLLAKKPELIRTIEEHGDIDRPSILMAKMLPHLGMDGLKLAKFIRFALG
jgi:digeranylgeranylglycerophospholipid reductase